MSSMDNILIDFNSESIMTDKIKVEVINPLYEYMNHTTSAMNLLEFNDESTNRLAAKSNLTIQIDENCQLTGINKEEVKRTSLFLDNLNAHITNHLFKPNSNQNIKQNDQSNVPEDNVERLRNIREMFESAQQEENQQQQELIKVEKQQPSEKLKERLLNENEFLSDDLINDNEFTLVPTYTKTKQQAQIMIDSLDENETPLLLLNDENKQTSESSSSSPSVSSLSSNNSETTSREISPPLHDDRFEDAGESEGKDLRVDEKKIDMPHVELTSRKTMFESHTQHIDDSPRPRKCITPPPEGANIGEIENKPAERLQNVISSADKFEDKLPESGLAKSRKEMFQQIAHEPTSPQTREHTHDALPSVGATKQTAALFASNGESTRKKSIDRSGITIEGELTEKGIAKQRLAMFNHMQQDDQLIKQQVDTVDANMNGIARERLNLFKNLEQQRTSPSKETPQKKLKEFTPPPQLDAHMQQQRQYVIIEKETQAKQTPLEQEQAKTQEQETQFLQGLAKNRMKQYLETAQQSEKSNGNQEQEALPEKGSAKSLLAKWKSIENIQDDAQTNVRLPRGVSRERTPPSPSCTSDILPQMGTAKSLLSKWQNIDKQQEPLERKSRQMTPPRVEELQMIEKGFARQALARFEKNTCTTYTNNNNKNESPSKINIPEMSATKVFYENIPAESNISLQYNNDEEVIPSPGFAKQLKSKFQTLEKEACKVETSSSKLAYVPKRFTSSVGTSSSNSNKTTPNKIASSTTTTTPKTNANSNTSINSCERCYLCEKTVYVMEKIEADKKLYHKLCFKCTICSCTLKLGNFSSIKGQLYCTPHYIQLFARNGNYDEGFGLENYKRKWLNGNSTSTSGNITNENSIA